MWQRCHDMVQAHLDNALCAYLHHDLIHCSAVTLISHQHLYPSNTREMKEYQREFRAIAEALRARMSLEQVRRVHNI